MEASKIVQIMKSSAWKLYNNSRKQNIFVWPLRCSVQSCVFSKWQWKPQKETFMWTSAFMAFIYCCILCMCSIFLCIKAFAFVQNLLLINIRLGFMMCECENVLQCSLDLMTSSSIFPRSFMACLKLCITLIASWLLSTYCPIYSHTFMYMTSRPVCTQAKFRRKWDHVKP